MSAWTLRDVVVRYGTNVAVDGVDLAVDHGERVGLVGHSGSGKTSLVRAGLGLAPRQQGTVDLLGQPTAGWSETRWRRARRDVQMLFQDPRAMLHPVIPLGLLLMDSAVVHQIGENPEREARAVLDSVGLGTRFDALPHELSGGEQRRAGLARVLLTRPRLLIADEPTVGMDVELKEDLLSLLLDRLDPACAVVLVTHDLPVVAWATTRIVVMSEGRIVDELGTDNLTEPTHPTSRELLSAGGLLAGENP